LIETKHGFKDRQHLLEIGFVDASHAVLRLAHPVGILGVSSKATASPPTRTISIKSCMPSLAAKSLSSGFKRGCKVSWLVWFYERIHQGAIIHVCASVVPDQIVRSWRIVQSEWTMPWLCWTCFYDSFKVD
jgi:hypothetical protein